MTSSFSLLKRALHIFKNDAKRYLIIVAIPTVISFILAFLDPEINPAVEGNSSLMLLFTVLTAVSLVISIFMTIALIYAVADQSLTPKEAYNKSKADFFRYLGLVILMTLIIVAGLVLLIIPGIWLSILLSFSAYFLLLEKKGIKASLSASKELVTGRWWAVAIRMMVFTLFGILVFMIAGVIGAIFGELGALILTTAVGTVVGPIGLIYSYEVYKELKGTESVSVETPIQSV
jgi:hypothetical protein